MFYSSYERWAAGGGPSAPSRLHPGSNPLPLCVSQPYGAAGGAARPWSQREHRQHSQVSLHLPDRSEAARSDWGPALIGSLFPQVSDSPCGRGHVAGGGRCGEP